MFDVRCLPNPYYDPRLRPLTEDVPKHLLPVGERPAAGAALNRAKILAEWEKRYGAKSEPKK